MKLIKLMLMVLTVSIASAQGLSFKGVPLGVSLAEFTEKYAQNRASDVPKPLLEFGTVFTVKLTHSKETADFRRTGKIIASLGLDGGSIAGVDATIGYTFYASLLADWDRVAEPYLQNGLRFEGVNKSYKQQMEDLKKPSQSWKHWTPEAQKAAKEINLGIIAASFAESDFETVIDALTEKYGKPTEEKKATYQNLAGASLEGLTVIWKVGTDVIEARQYNRQFNKSAVVFMSPTVIARGKAITRQLGIKTGADDL